MRTEGLARRQPHRPASRVPVPATTLAKHVLNVSILLLQKFDESIRVCTDCTVGICSGGVFEQPLSEWSHLPEHRHQRLLLRLHQRFLRHNLPKLCVNAKQIIDNGSVIFWWIFSFVYSTGLLQQSVSERRFLWSGFRPGALLLRL